MNHWKMCLQCWIPVSKKNDKTSVINAGAHTETEDLDRLSSISLDPVPQFPQLPIPYRRSSAVEDAHFWTPPPPPPPPPPTQTQTQYAGDTSENYIALDECHSGVTRGVSRVPKLVSRDIHLLDRVPPSPCSLAENPGTFPGVGGMREVYAPMLPSPRSLVGGGGGGPPGLSPRLAARGNEGPSRRTQQVTGPPYAKRDVHELQGPVEGSPSPGHHRVADLRNNNNNNHNGGTCFSFKAEHVRLANSSRSDSRTPPTRLAYSSVSSEAAAASPTDPTRPFCPSRPSTAIAGPDSHSSVATSARSETLPHRSVHRAVDRPCVVYQQSLPLTVREISDRRLDRSGPSTPRLRTDSGGDVSRSRCGGGGPAGPSGGDGGGGAAEAGIDGQSLDSKMLHMTPPAPLQSNNGGGKLKAHRYVNANGSSSGQRGPDELQDLCCQNSATPGCPNHAGSLLSSGPQTATNDSDGYYNLIPTSNNQPTKTENGEPSTPPPPLPPPCHGPSGSRKKQFHQRPHIRHDSPHRRSPISVALPRRAKLEWNRSADDSSSSNDDDGSSSGFSATNSNTSLNRPGDAAAASLLKSFTTKPPAPSLQQPRIEYLQLDLDQPITVTRGSPGPVHRSQNSTIDYIEIDPRRTKALSDTKRQLESNRHKTSH